MTHSDVFNAVRLEYGEPLAILALVVYTLNLTLEVKPKDMKKPGSYTKRLRAKVDAKLWQEKKADVQLAWEVAMQLHAYDICQMFGKPGGGIGGCLPKTLKQLVEEERGRNAI